MSKKEFTITIYTENNVGLLSRIAAMFSRRRINIESLNVAASEVEGIHRFTVVMYDTEEVARKLIQQIEKQVEVFKSYFYTNDEIVWQEHTLYKVANNNHSDETMTHLLKNYSVRCVSVDKDFVVYETTGSGETTVEIEKLLGPMGITEIVKSARIAVIRNNHTIHQKLKQIEPLQNVPDEYVY
jgi:acetolactate synthase-1/3 small subunit